MLHPHPAGLVGLMTCTNSTIVIYEAVIRPVDRPNRVVMATSLAVGSLDGVFPITLSSTSRDHPHRSRAVCRITV